MNHKLRELIFAALDGTIDRSSFDELQNRLEQSAEARQLYLECVELFESLGESELGVTSPDASGQNDGPRNLMGKHFLGIAIFLAASILVCSAIAFSLGRYLQRGNLPNDREIADTTTLPEAGDETMVAGHASLRSVLDARWGERTPKYVSGDLIPEGKLALEKGTIELEFFCGASLVIEGPAAFEVVSDWELTFFSGDLRANVPPAARGFIVNAADSKIVDLGTEFSLSVSTEEARVDVIDGEVEIRRPSEDPLKITQGQQEWLAGSKTDAVEATRISSPSEIEERSADHLRLARSRWLRAVERLRSDERMIGYYPIRSQPFLEPETNPRRIKNASVTGDERDGFLIGSVARTTGRFGRPLGGLEFGRPGSRMRVRLEGEYAAFTFITWVKIDSLEHAYNALFMADGYEDGEPHWQIAQDGTMMLSVMIDDDAEVMHYSKLENAVVRGAGRHRIYRTPPIWDLSKSGRWMQLAAVFDPAEARVRQYVDGDKVLDVAIEPDWLPSLLRIGNAEIGNWGQPFRETPSFAVRNLDGTIDEMMLFDAAFGDNEIKDLYEAGKL